MNKHAQRISRHIRVRTKVSGTEKKPRLSVFRSNQHIYAQIIDDSSAKTLVSASSQKVAPNPKDEKSKKISASYLVGIEIAKKALNLKIKNIIFDRGGYKFHGRVKSLAEGAREGGLVF